MLTIDQVQTARAQAIDSAIAAKSEHLRIRQQSPLDTTRADVEHSKNMSALYELFQAAISTYHTTEVWLKRFQEYVDDLEHGHEWVNLEAWRMRRAAAYAAAMDMFASGSTLHTLARHRERSMAAYYSADMAEETRAEGDRTP